jgi:uncharacterized protein (DUF697 family)
MNRKKLPKVIVRTREAVPPAPVVAAERGHTPSTHPAPMPASIAEVVALKPIPAPESGPTPSEPVRPAPRGFARARAIRRARAMRIVNRHAGLSAVGGVLPLPIANFASVTAVILRMVKVLSDHYSAPFERDRARAIVVAMVVGAMPTGLGAVASSALFYIVPGAALPSLAISSFSAAACTRGIGRIFVEHFESGATLADFPDA